MWDCRVPLFLFLLPCYLFYWYGLPLEKSLLYFVAFFLYQNIKIKLSFWVFTSILFIAIEHILNGSWRSQNYIIKRMKMIWPLFSIRFLHLLLNILWKSFTIMIKIILCLLSYAHQTFIFVVKIALYLIVRTIMHRILVLKKNRKLFDFIPFIYYNLSIQREFCLWNYMLKVNFPI